MTALIVYSVVVTVLLIGACLAAYDMIRQLCEDLDNAKAELEEARQPANVVPFRTVQKDRIAGMVAASVARREFEDGA